MKPLVQAEIDYLEHLHMNAAQGRWHARRGTVVSDAYQCPYRCDMMESRAAADATHDLAYYGGELIGESILRQSDADLIAHMRNLLPRIIAQLRSTLPRQQVGSETRP